MPDLGQSAGNQRAALLEQIAFHERAAATLRAILTETTPAPPAVPRAVGGTSLPMLSEDLVEVSRIAGRLRKSESTVRRWCAEHDIGARMAGRWYVSLSRLESFLERENIVLSGKI